MQVMKTEASPPDRPGASATDTTPKASSRGSGRLRSRYGPWAVVTGASSGIGRAFALQLASAGFNPVLTARRGDVLDGLAADLAAQHGVKTRAIPIDLGREDAPAFLAHETQDLDVGLLVCAAGFGSSGRFLDADLDNEIDMVGVNCSAAMSLSHRFGRRFADRGRGGLVLMSSLVAFQGVPFAAHYAATKAYVQSLAEALRIELAPHGIDVVASAPGPIYSGFAERADMRFGMGHQPACVAEATLRALGRRSTVRPGWISKFLEGSLRMLPRSGRVRMMAKVMQGMAQGA